ncbi:translation factor GTPase family protein [Dactylosporangium sp. NPDC006015]|uniref:translation factor GTPase family protein n=1 Tax=Dactylosporangium sp. NPDC006015 TaxID=3154576 RepID=UPI0033AA4285
MTILNLGIVAHVDAGKTSLTERLLFRAGVIDRIGSVDDGSTQTDSLALERQRGITIKSAVASFPVGGVTVNLIDTPGHPDFIAEVERALRVLDGAVLVVSAVEGVQAQTRILMRTLRRLRVPTLIFVNKIDRRGARHEDLLADLAAMLTPALAPMGRPTGLGTPGAAFEPGTARLAEALAEHDEQAMAAFVHDAADVRLEPELARQTAAGLVHPVYFGSATTGAGVDALVSGLATILPAATGDPGAPLSATVFKVERGPAGEKIAYVRLFAGTIHVRDQLPAGKVTAIGIPSGGTAVPVGSVAAGQIGKLWGLRTVRIGDTIGADPPRAGAAQLFAPPTLETVVVPRNPRDRARLHAALAQLAEQDPLIDLRLSDTPSDAPSDAPSGSASGSASGSGAGSPSGSAAGSPGVSLAVSLYGEVQKEVIEATLAAEYGVLVDFRESTIVYVEQVAGTGSAVELLGAPDNPFLATVGLRVEPSDRGVEFHLDVPVESMPMYVYNRAADFEAAMSSYVRDTLRQGLHGWNVTGARVTMTTSGYQAPGSSAADYRKLTPLVLMRALRQAGTRICEPVHRFHLEIPASTTGVVLGLLSKLGAVPSSQDQRRDWCEVTGTIPAARIRDLERRLPGISHGLGVLEYAFDHHRPVHGTPPVRPRSDHNPLNRKEYLLWVSRRVAAGPVG